MPRTSLLIDPEPLGRLEDRLRDKSAVGRWGSPDIFRSGWLSVPTLFLKVYAHLKPYPLTPGEAMFILELMSFKWTRDAPFPSYATVAERMNVSTKMVRRYAQSLEAKKYLHREYRKNKSNKFVLNGFFQALSIAAGEEQEKSRKGKMQAEKS